ncbi:MAG: PaeR7I family type II restriction endonuclease [Ignavibacteriales bacterium]|nr:PaeR7I family type II restriction endonuclease [Ignavibacteriales bacterium]
MFKDLEKQIQKAVATYWRVRSTQSMKQKSTERIDQGARSAVTGGAHMDGFVDLISHLIEQLDIPQSCIHRSSKLELPGFFRPTKEWDLLVVKNGQLLAAMEFKSQVGPSFGNNFNNRTEEAMGSAVDLWTAYRESAFNSTIKPWLGYLFLLEDCEGSNKPVKVQEPHFPVLTEFKGASYAKRYEIFCRKLVRERHYSNAAFLMSDAKKGLKGKYSQPAGDLTFEFFAHSLAGQLMSIKGSLK